MKKIIPVIILLLGVGVLIGAFFVVRGRNKTPDQNTDQTQEEIAPEVPLEKRPVTSLTPTTDGHWLTLKVGKIQIDAATLDYLLLYNLPDGRSQGVPGTVKLSGDKSIERKLLLGSESSGKFRYDEGVQKGTLELKFRDSQGKLTAKFSTDFHLQSGSDGEFTSVDNNFSYKLSAKKLIKGFFVTMKTFGLPDNTIGKTLGEPYGIFSSSDLKTGGKVTMPGNSMYYWDGKSWISLESSSLPGIGIFVTAS